MRTDRWAIETQTGITYIAITILVTFHKLLFQPQTFSSSLYENFVFIHWRSLYKAGLEQLFLPRLDWRPVTEESQQNAWAHAGKQIKLFMFLFHCFLVWLYNIHLINRARSVCMGESWPRSLVQISLRSVCTGDLGHDSPIQTSRSVNKS